jgi:uncharacterized protein YjiS (DUF1127 family)
MRQIAFGLPGRLLWVRSCWPPVRMLDRLLAARERARQRRLLATLDDRMLRDIGLTRGCVERESGKWSWRP